MRLLNFIVFVILFSSCRNSSGFRVSQTTSQEMQFELDTFFKERTNKVIYYTSKEPSSQQKVILQKLSKLIGNNSNTRHFFESAEGKKMPKYSSNIGISRQEYNSLTNLFSYQTPRQSTGSLTIKKKDYLIEFIGSDSLASLDSLSIDVKSNTARFGQTTLVSSLDSLNLSNDFIPEGETLESIHFFQPSGLGGLLPINGSYKLLVGKLKPSGQTYLAFFARQPNILEHPLTEFYSVIIEK
jgi:hypothetical protein